MADTIRNELKKKYLAEGGLEENLTNDSQTVGGNVAVQQYDLTGLVLVN